MATIRGGHGKELLNNDVDDDEGDNGNDGDVGSGGDSDSYNSDHGDDAWVSGSGGGRGHTCALV